MKIVNQSKKYNCVLNDADAKLNAVIYEMSFHKKYDHFVLRALDTDIYIVDDFDTKYNNDRLTINSDDLMNKGFNGIVDIIKLIDKDVNIVDVDQQYNMVINQSCFVDCGKFSANEQFVLGTKLILFLKNTYDSGNYKSYNAFCKDNFNLSKAISDTISSMNMYIFFICMRKHFTFTEVLEFFEDPYLLGRFEEEVSKVGFKARFYIPYQVQYTR